jgi:ribosomal protein L37AE/L43A
MKERIYMNTNYNTNTCPVCGSKTHTYKHVYAKIWCSKCGFVLRNEGSKTLNDYSSYLSKLLENNEIPTPVFHKPIPLGTKVRTKENALNKILTGEVVGVSFENVFFCYIVLLDEPIQTKHGLERAATIPGTCLESIDGTSFENKE